MTKGPLWCERLQIFLREGGSRTGGVSKAFPDSAIRGMPARTGKASIRQHDPPAEGVVNYVIALALYMQSSDREVLR